MKDFRDGLVSVIVPVFNRASLVSQAIESILAQTYRNIEVIVINDGSTDGTEEILARYAGQYPDHVRVLKQLNAGQVVAKNRGIRAAEGEYIAFLDSDDTWKRDKLDLQIPLFHGNVGLVYCAIHEIDDSGNMIRTISCEPGARGNIHEQLLVKNRMTGSSVIVRRNALDAVGIFDERLRAAENWDLWIRISKEFEADFINEPLVNYLQHNANISRNKILMRESAWAILQKHLPKTLITGSPLYEPYLEAYANFYYNWGVANFSAGEYLDARQKFRNCWQFLPGYRDSRIRYFRTFLSRFGNSMLSSFAAKLRAYRVTKDYS